jgi:hypothetical protein
MQPSDERCETGNATADRGDRQAAYRIIDFHREERSGHGAKK